MVRNVDDLLKQLLSSGLGIYAKALKARDRGLGLQVPGDEP